MNKMQVILQGDLLYISYNTLEYLGISYNTIKKYGTDPKKKQFIFKQNGLAYIWYGAIGDETRTKLPTQEAIIAAANAQAHDTKVNEYIKAFRHCMTVDFIKYRKLYTIYGWLKDEKITEYAQLHAIFTYCMEDRDRISQFAAFQTLFPAKYKCQQVFDNTKTKFKKQGHEAAIVDKRPVISSQNGKRVAAKNIDLVRLFVAAPQKLSASKIHKLVCKECEATGITPPSLGWVALQKTEILRTSLKAYKARHGVAQAHNDIMPKASLIDPLYVGDQLQVDGWVIPLWYREGGKLKRLTMCVVMDGHSKKIVGVSVDKSENTGMVIEALRDAAKNTGFLPFEYVMDKSCFTRTKQHGLFVDALAAKGLDVTVDSNPRRKATLERSFQNIDAIIRLQYGYLGKGIRSKSLDALPSEEQFRMYAKNPLTVEQITDIALCAVDEYNNTVLPKHGKTPNELYEASEQKSCIQINHFERLKMVTAGKAYKAIQGQITIQSDFTEYEFLLPVNIHLQYNNRQVLVRYERLDEHLYLYDNETGEPIGIGQPKVKIHGAKANQTPADLKALGALKERRKLIEASDTSEDINTDYEHVLLDGWEKKETTQTARELNDTQKYLPVQVANVRPANDDESEFEAAAAKLTIFDDSKPLWDYDE